MVDEYEFLTAVKPALASGNATALFQAVTERWHPSQICTLLDHESVDVRRVAAMTIGLVGDLSMVRLLTRALSDNDPQVNQMAEQGMWSILFRSCCPQAAKPFKNGVKRMKQEEYQQAINLFKQAIQIDPKFAEAYNQCAMAHYFIGRYENALHDCRMAKRLVPVHFDAIATMGHCYTELGDFPMALHYYRRALEINPHLVAVEQAIARLKIRYREDINEASGEFLVDSLV